MPDLESIENLRNLGLHQILFRNAGVGFQFYEPPDGYKIDIRDTSGNWKQYLVIYDYYPTLKEAISAEMTQTSSAEQHPPSASP